MAALQMRLGQLDEVAVRVAQVERADRAQSRRSAATGPSSKTTPASLELALDRVERALDEQADVGRPGGRAAARAAGSAGPRWCRLIFCSPKRSATRPSSNSSRRMPSRS